MPQVAIRPVSRSVRVRERERFDRLQDRYYVARFLTFLCDLVWAGIPGETPTWTDIQAQLKSRYSQVYLLEAAKWPGAPAAA